jgi:replicative DNA helicase
MTQSIGGDVTWKSEFYFLASLVGTPRYLMSVESPHNLFANKDLLVIYRMMEQAINLRGHSDPLIDKIHRGELELTAEYKRSVVDLKTLWPDLSDPAIKGAPDKFHGLLEHYAALRFMQEKFSSRLSDMHNGVYGPEEAVSHIQNDVVSIHMSEQYESSSIRSMIYDMWFDRFKNPPATIKTGFKKMDDVIGALIPGCTYLWTARTSHGKSSWVAQIVNNQAEAGHKVGIISLEDSRSVWASRWMSKVSGVTLGKIRDNVLTAPEEGTLTTEDQSALELATYKDYLDNVMLVDAKGAKITDILRIMSDMVVRQGCQIIYVDYLQAIYADARNTRSRRDWLEYCWAMMEREADRLAVPLMLTAQLNREWENNPLPSMPGLRNTEWMGAAEQKCYVGAVIYRPYRDPRLPQDERNARFDELLINIEKCKQGQNIAVNYSFDPSRSKITEK